MREKRYFLLFCIRTEGITPACAGKTIAYADTVSGSGDHPRVCGKNKFRLAIWIRCLGSPPRVREKRNLQKG